MTRIPMCLVLFAFDPASPRPLVVAANRDEFYARPARTAHFWEDRPDLLAGRDLSAGGTWLGVSRSGRFATVTNFAEEGPSEAPLSRGLLTEGFLSSRVSAHDFAHGLHTAAYRGFNLLLFDGASLVYTSNRGHSEDLEPGVYGLANAELGATWPKVMRGRAALAQAAAAPDPDRLLALLADQVIPPDDELPRRGRPLDLERRVAPCFIAGDDYGTRASTAVIIGRDRVVFAEQEYFERGRPGRRSTFEFAIEA
jgi:uncharacterized protein with NRDE domain